MLQHHPESDAVYKQLIDYINATFDDSDPEPVTRAIAYTFLSMLRQNHSIFDALHEIELLKAIYLAGLNVEYQVDSANIRTMADEIKATIARNAQ